MCSCCICLNLTEFYLLKLVYSRLILTELTLPITNQNYKGMV